MIKTIFIILFISTQINAFVGVSLNIVDDLFRAIKLTKKIKLSKAHFIDDFIKNPHLYKEEFKLLSHKQKIDFLSEIAVKKGVIKSTKQLFYINKLNRLKDGDKILLSMIQKNQNLSRIRRITNVEKSLMTSKQAVKTKMFGRTVVKRKIFQCNKQNIALMLNGNSPLGFDSKRVELHHLKQQKNGNLIELTQIEHKEHTKVLHRYTKTSEITDRNSKFANFRGKYWKTRAADCIARRK